MLPGKRGLVDLEPLGQLLALPAFIFDLAFRRLEPPGFLAQRFGELLAAPADRPDGFLGARDLRSRAEHVAIAPVERFRGLGAGGPRLLQRRLGPALAGERRVEPALLIRNLRGLAARLPIERPPLQCEVLGFERALGRLELTVFFGQLGLALEMRQMASELLPQIVQPFEVLGRVAHPVLGLAAAFLVLGDPRRFLDEIAQVLRFGFDDPRNHPLFDDRVAARPEPGAVEDVHHVTAPAPRSVQPVLRLPLARDLAAYRDFLVRGKAASDPAVEVVEDQLDARLAHRLAGPRAVEHDVRHGVPAQAARRDFAHHPSDRVDDVRLAAAVRPHHADDAAGKLDGRGIDEGLEAREPDLA